MAQFVSTQLELAELDRSRQRAVQAELRFLRAQISPHFIYNALTAIESFVRTDPDRARELLVEFADFTRYSFRSHGQFVTMAEELRLVDTYLDLERARFGDRLEVTLRVAPEVLSVMLPSLVLQPMVENAVRHGLEPSARPGHLEITVIDADSDAEVSVEDNGVGADPGQIRRALAGTNDEDGVGLHNVDERLRTVFGDDARPDHRDGARRRDQVSRAHPQVPRRGPGVTNGLIVLAVDDETPALDELVYLLADSALASHVRAVRAPPTPCASSTRSASTSSSSTSPCPVSTASNWPSAGPLLPPAGDRLRHGPRGARPGRLRRRGARVTCSSRSTRSAC